MLVTNLVKYLFLARQRELDQYYNAPETLQPNVLRHLLHRAQDTEYGVHHLFGNIKNYEDFAQNVPLNTYEELKGDIERMRHGETDILWPGRVKWFAKSQNRCLEDLIFLVRYD